MFHRFTERAWSALETALSLAHEYRHAEAGADHLLLGLLADPASLAGRALHGVGVDPVAARDALLQRRVEEAFGDGALDVPPQRGRTTRIGPWRATPGALGDDVTMLLRQSLREARRLGHHYLGTEHLLLALLHTDNAGRALLIDLGADTAAIDAALEASARAA